MTRRFEPVSLSEFRKLSDDHGEIEIPELPENRVSTDRIHLVIFGVTVLLLIAFLIYTLIYSDVDRFFLNADDCGNLCGKDNVKYDEWACSGKDYTHQKFWQPTGKIYESWDNKGTRLQSGECVATCSPGYKTVGNRCVNQTEGEGLFDNISDVARIHYWGAELVDYLKSVAWKIILLCILSLVISVSIMFLLHTSTAAMVWSILAASIIFGLVVVGILWYMYYTGDERHKIPYLISAIVFSIVLFIFVCIIVFLCRKIYLVIALLREAMKATFAMPLILLIPILSFITTTIVFILLCTTNIYMASSGRLTEVAEGYLTYEPSVLMLFTIIFNICVALWATQLIIGIQYMAIAGAVSKWYFAMDKNDLNWPILTSCYVAFRFHLGSIAFGSMVIMLVAILRVVISALTRNKGIIRICCNICMSAIEDFLKFLSKNAYILIAMHGKPFYVSGKRAAQIIFQNMLNIVAINYIGDFIIAMAQVLVIIIVLLFTYLIMEYNDYIWIVYLIVGVASLIIAAICFSVIETVIDTIFLCFCEDSLLNDGMARPYAMSTDLMEFVDKAKKVFVNKNQA